MSVHFIVQFHPPPDAIADFRSELLMVVHPTRTEPGCRAIRVFESISQPSMFAIHSEWNDEAAFELHARLPHTLRFLAAAERLLGTAIQGLRAREICEESTWSDSVPGNRF